MSKSRHLWAIGFDDTEGASQLRDEVVKLGWEKHCLILVDVAVAVRYSDGTFTLNGEPFLDVTNIVGRTFACLLAGLALRAPPLTGTAASAALGSFGADTADVGISDEFVRYVKRLI